MNGALTVIAISVAVLAAVQIGILVAVALMLGRVLDALRQLRDVQRSLAAAADEIGRAAHQFGDLAGTTRNAAEGLLGVLALRRLIPGAGSGLSFLRTGLDLASTLMGALRHRAGRDAGPAA